MSATEGPSTRRDHADRTLAELLAERERHVLRLSRVYRSFSTWGIGVGKLRIRASVGSNVIAIVFVAWHLLLGAGGVLSILTWEGGRELGIALLVGALFSFGSFLARFWSQAMDKEREFLHEVWHEDDVQQLRETLESLADLDRRISRRPAGSPRPGTA